MRKLKYIFDTKLRPGDKVIHTVSDDTLEFINEYIPGLTSVVKHRGTTSVPFLVADVNIRKFRGFMFCEWVGQRAKMFNQRIARHV